MSIDRVTLRPVAEFAGRADEVVGELRGELLELIPEAEVEHIGATAHGRGFTKGDVDISVVIPADRFARGVEVLRERFTPAQPENWTPTYASFSVADRSLPVGLQVAVKGSVDDFLVPLRDLFRARPDLLVAYDACKREAAPLGPDGYWRAKDAFLQRLFAEHLPDRVHREADDGR